MKRNLKLSLLSIIVMLLFITNVNAAYYNNYNSTVNYANVYISKFTKHQYYIDRDTTLPYQYDGTTLSVNSKFKTGGLINKAEFDIAGAMSSYLFNGSKFFTMTEASSKVYSINNTGPELVSLTSTSGARPTNYIQKDVNVTGSGTYVDPWIFADKYELKVSTNEPTHSTVTPAEQFVTNGNSAQVTFTVDNEYEYDTNTCGGTVSGNTMTISNVTADKDCEIRFKHKKYIISYDPAGGSACASVEVTPQTAIGTLCNSTRTGHTLNGWYTATSGGTKVTASTIPTSNMTLYAHWSPTVYTVTYNLNGGTGSSCTNKTITYGAEYGTLCTPTKTGNTFGGWYSDSALTNKVTSTTLVSTTSNVNLYAKWTPNTYTITYNTNGGGSGCTSTKSVTYGGTYGTLCTPTATGNSSFKGWYTAASGGTLITSTSTVNITSNTTLYAQWELSCFAFTPSSGTITDYYDYYGNSSSNAACPKAVTIPSSIGGVNVKVIGTNAFRNKGITSVTIPNTVRYIYSYAFYKNNLTSLTVPSSVNWIDGYAFANNKLSSLTLNEGITSIYSNAFENNALTTLKMPSSLTYIGYKAFKSNQISSITMNSTIEQIDELAFFRNKLTSVTIPSSVTFLGGGAFNDNQLPANQALFYARKTDGTEDKTTVVSYGGAIRTGLSVPAGVTTLGRYAYYCNDITTLTLTSGIVDIQYYALGFNEMKNIVIPSTVKTIGNYAVQGNWATSITIPTSVTSIGAGAFNANRDPNNPFIYKRNSDGTEDKTTIVSYKNSGGENSGLNITIPAGVTKIGTHAFFNDYIGTVTFPEGLKTIESYAFKYCVLSGTVTIPSSVTSIGAGAFAKGEYPSVTGNSILKGNYALNKIVNKTGKAFQWDYIINYDLPDYTLNTASTVTTTITSPYGNVTITQ